MTPIASILLTLVLGTTASTEAQSRASDAASDTTTEERLDIVWSTPTIGPPELVDWYEGYRREMRPILSAWARMLHRLRGELPALFDRQCAGLVSSLERLDEMVLLPAPDRLIDFYLKRLLLHLRAAGIACSRSELYNVVYRLDEARSALGEVRWQLEQRGLP